MPTLKTTLVKYGWIIRKLLYWRNVRRRDSLELYMSSSCVVLEFSLFSSLNLKNNDARKAFFLGKKNPLSTKKEKKKLLTN